MSGFEGRVGRMVVTENTVLTDAVQGDVEVGSGASIEVSSLITGDLHIAPGAAADLRGCVDGVVVNHGALVVGAMGSCLAIIDVGEATSIIDDEASIFLGRIDADAMSASELLSRVTRRTAGPLDAA